MNTRLLATLATLALALPLHAPARADRVAYDGFDNGPLPNLAGANGGTGWSGPWQD